MQGRGVRITVVTPVVRGHVAGVHGLLATNDASRLIASLAAGKIAEGGVYAFIAKEWHRRKVAALVGAAGIQPGWWASARQLVYMKGGYAAK